MRIQIIISHFLFTSWKPLSVALPTLSNGSVSLLTSTFWCILLPFWDRFFGLAPVALYWFFKRHLNEFVSNFWWFWNSWSADKLFETSVFITLALGLCAGMSINRVFKAVEKSNWSHVKSFLEVHLHLSCNLTAFELLSTINFLFDCVLTSPADPVCFCWVPPSWFDLAWPGSDVRWDGPLVAGVGCTLVAGCSSPPPGGVSELADPVSDLPSVCCKLSWLKHFAHSQSTLSLSEVGTVSKKSVISNTSFEWILRAKATTVPFDNAIGSLEFLIILHNVCWLAIIVFTNVISGWFLSTEDKALRNIESEITGLFNLIWTALFV